MAASDNLSGAQFPKDFTMQKFAQGIGIQEGVTPSAEQSRLLNEVGGAYVMHRLGNMYVDSGRFNPKDHGGQAPLVEVPSSVPKDEHGAWLNDFAKRTPPGR